MTTLTRGRSARRADSSGRRTVPRFVFAATTSAAAVAGGLLLLSVAVAVTDPTMTLPDALGMLLLVVLLMPVVSLGLILLFGWLVLVTFTLLRDRTRWAGLLAGFLPGLLFAAMAMAPMLGGLVGAEDPASAIGPWGLVLLPCVAWCAISAAALARLLSSEPRRRAAQRTVDARLTS
ncbi:hypothetical protein [Pseudoclavibacter helvolus]|uniref:hypothetical protein n=1 Tax=Pseudoclavibacter helvolus TaxID=255205 RepID=UPI0024AD2C9C|nr:hypothetical protein [Pseudoclavibacter helvolus]